MYAVIKLNGKSAEQIGAFSSKKSAKRHIRKIKFDIFMAEKKRHEYIENFVNSYILPPHSEWSEFMKKFHHLGIIFFPRKTFKYQMKKFLKENNSVNLEDYYPPKIIVGWDNLIVVRIKTNFKFSKKMFWSV